MTIVTDPKAFLEGVADQLVRHREHLLEELEKCSSMIQHYEADVAPAPRLRVPDCDERVWLAPRFDQTPVMHRAEQHQQHLHPNERTSYFVFPAGVFNLDAVELCQMCFARADGPMGTDEGMS